MCVRSMRCTTDEFVFNDCKNLNFGQVCKEGQTDRQTDRYAIVSEGRRWYRRCGNDFELSRFLVLSSRVS